MREPYRIEETARGVKLRMGVNESRELSRRIIYREILDGSGKATREPTPWERIIFCLRRSGAGSMEDHEQWMAFLQTPTWVHVLKADFLDDWLYFPVKDSHATPSALGRRFGEWFGKSRVALEAVADDPILAAEILECGFEPFEDGDLFDDLVTEIIAPHQSRILKHRAAMVGRSSKFAALGSFEDSTAYFAGFSIGLRSARKALDEKAFEISKEREFVARVLSDEWEKIEGMASRSEARDYVASRLPARMRRALISSDEGQSAFRERMLALFKQIGLNLAGRGKPPNNGSKLD